MVDPMAPKPPSRSRVEMTQIVMPGDANPLGTAFGGKIMQWIDIAAAVAARRHAGSVAVTASMDSLTFHRPIRQGNVVVLRASVNRAWRTSMEAGVRVEFEVEVERDEGSQHAASAYLTFVAVDEAGRPRPVSPVVPETVDDRRRYEDAGRRRERRISGRDNVPEGQDDHE
jgi:acyl-CoA hydrolase